MTLATIEADMLPKRFHAERERIFHLDADGAREGLLTLLSATADNFVLMGLHILRLQQLEVEIPRQLTSVAGRLAMLASGHFDDRMFALIYASDDYLFNAVGKLPLEAQQSLAAEKIELATGEIADGEPDVMLAEITELSAEQVKQVFDGGRVRTPLEQLNWCRTHRKAVSEPLRRPRWAENRGAIEIHGPTRLTLKDWRAMGNQMGWKP